MRTFFRHLVLICSATTAMIVGTANVSRADFITATFGVPTADQGSWSYSKAAGVGQFNAALYQPLIGDWSAAVFQGYVHAHSGPAAWDTVGAGTHDEDTIYVFKTYFLSHHDMTIPIHFDGDDGHSLYVNGNVIAGGGFGDKFNFNLNLVADIPTKIEIGNYNGHGAMAVSFHEQSSLESLDQVPGLMVNANGNFSAVPEPSTFALLGLGGIGLAIGSYRRRKAKDNGTIHTGQDS